MIDARISIQSHEPAEQHDELMAAARALKKPVVRVEVEYPSERLPGKSWDMSSDALEIDVATGAVTLLPPYTEVAP